MLTMKQSDSFIFWRRTLMFAAIGFFMTWGPFYRHILKGRSPIFRQWRMYSGIGIGMYDARYYLQTPAGPQRINRPELLKKSFYPQERYKRLIMNPAMLQKNSREICQAFRSSVDVRLFARIATMQGWKVISRGGKNICLNQS